ncbi:MAG: hypothetical protein WDW36_004108 [Sanguina aurantia]
MRLTAGSKRPVSRRTSEYWYEEEPDYDAITELLPPKRVYLCSPQPHALPTQGAAQSAEARRAHAATDGSTTSDPGSGPSLQAVTAALQGLAMTCGFTSSSHAVDADVLWRLLGQGRAPYFRKLRTRATLSQLEDPDLNPAQVTEACDGLWQELCGQSWKVELDYGLATASSPLTPVTEHLLIVASSTACARLGASLGRDASAPVSDGSVVTVDFRWASPTRRSECLLRAQSV